MEKNKNIIQKELYFLEKKKETDVKINGFKWLYENLKDKAITNDEIFSKYDLTNVFFEWIKRLILNKELFNCSVLGNPASGKSTIMCLLIDKGNQILKEEGLFALREDKKKDEKVLGMKEGDFIFADQNEFLTTIKKELWSCFIGIDEYNRLADTGVNSMIEMLLNATYSDIFAQQNVHRVLCSPSTIGDINCWLILEVYGTNRKEKTTTCKVFYRDIINNYKRCIGRVSFNVSEILEKEWYVAYREKKFKRMELLQREGIRKFSEMEFSIIILKVFDELKNIIDDKKVDGDLVLSFVKQELKEHFVGSMILENEIASEVRNLLNLLSLIIKEQKKRDKKLLEGKEEEAREIDRKIELLKEKLNKTIGFHEKMKKNYYEYVSIK